MVDESLARRWLTDWSFGSLGKKNEKKKSPMGRKKEVKNERKKLCPFFPVLHDIVFAKLFFFCSRKMCPTVV